MTKDDATGEDHKQTPSQAAWAVSWKSDHKNMSHPLHLIEMSGQELKFMVVRPNHDDKIGEINAETGKLNYEIMSVSRLERMVARVFMGNDAIKNTSWEQAEHHLAKAVEVAPDYPLFHFDLGQLLERRGRDDEAVTHLEQAATLPPVLVIDARVRERAHALLAKISS